MAAEPSNPSYKDERSTEPYNEDKVSSPEMLKRLRKEHRMFQGDWSHLERLVRNLDADKATADLETEKRLDEWNKWADSLQGQKPREFIHLEGAELMGAHLEEAWLQGAHLEGAELNNANLKRAKLWRAQLERAELVRANLEGVDLRLANLKQAKLNNANLERANLWRAQFERANLWRAQLERANLWRAQLEQAKLARASLEGAELSNANLEGANLYHAHLEGANLYHAHLEGAELLEANFEKADLRLVSGLRFDDNSVFRARIEGNAKDPWSVLRRSYTGPWFFVHLLLLIAFFSPYIGKFLYLSGLSQAQKYVINRAELLEGGLIEAENRFNETAYDHAMHAPWLPDVADAACEYRASVIDAWKEDLDRNFKNTGAIWVLLGWTSGYLTIVLGAIVVAYNACRAFLTLRVSSLRDAEERSHVTPGLREYENLYRIHQWARVFLWFAALSTLWSIGRWAIMTEVFVPIKELSNTV